eukprot:2145819-Rhodomonas_salina.1
MIDGLRDSLKPFEASSAFLPPPRRRVRGARSRPGDPSLALAPSRSRVPSPLPPDSGEPTRGL